MKYIQLTQGKFAIVDDEAFEELNKYKWYAHKVRNIWYAERMCNRKSIKMNWQVLDFPKGMIDHINRNGLDNRRSNLRICNNSQNRINCRMYPKNKSGYRGITFRKDIKKWCSRIKFNYKHICLGYFNDKIEAAKAYDKKAIELFGEFAVLNFTEV